MEPYVAFSDDTILEGAAPWGEDAGRMNLCPHLNGDPSDPHT